MKKILTLVSLLIIICTGAHAQEPTAAQQLLDRIGGAGTAEQFVLRVDESLGATADVFVLDSENGKPLIKGNTMSALTTGIGWYLNHYLNVNIAWNSLNEVAEGEAYTHLPALVLPKEAEQHTSDAAYRYYLNYCTFGYSMTSWTWRRWQKEIDWMALHGINMPLQIIGLEPVWRTFLMEDCGYSEADAEAFVPGPAFIGWWGMNNLGGWGGDGTDTTKGMTNNNWYQRQASLAKKILDRERELGMEPVLPGFSGMVPTNFTDKTGTKTDSNGGTWCGFQRPRIIIPSDNAFAAYAAKYYQRLEEVMGKSRYYSMDPFHEYGALTDGSEANYRASYRAVYEAMNTNVGTNTKWVIQQWEWQWYQKYSYTSLPDQRMIVLDLFSDGKPMFDSYGGYSPQEAVYCAIPNFGGRSGLMGRLENMANNYFNYKKKYTSIQGIGSAPEAIEQTPVTYDLLYELPWMNSQKPDIDSWVDSYATRRYGIPNANAQKAWELLRQSALGYGADAVQGPVEDVWAARPNLTANPASAWGKTLSTTAVSNVYPPARRQKVIEATHLLLSESNALMGSNYLYDLIEVEGQALADYAYSLLLGINEARSAGNTQLFNTRKEAFLQLMLDVDRLKGTNTNFRLGKWTSEAREAATEVEGWTEATKDWYELCNARTLITTWGDKGQSDGGGQASLRDYSYRSWQGLMRDYYYPRWKYYFDHNCTAPSAGWFYTDWNWAHETGLAVGASRKGTTGAAATRTYYSPFAEGDAVTIGQSLMEDYFWPLTTDDGPYYAYRFLDNDLTSLLSITAKTGQVLDLTPHFGKVESATLSGDFITEPTSDLAHVTISATTTDGIHEGVLTLQDGTSVRFSLAINPAISGYYKILYNSRPVYMAYNTTHDNASNEGYKMIINTGGLHEESAEVFHLIPVSGGCLLGVEGKYLKPTITNGWNHLMFSDSRAEAGIYNFEETATAGQYKLRCTSGDINYANAYTEHGVFGNDRANKQGLSTFTLQETTPVSITTVKVDKLSAPLYNLDGRKENHPQRGRLYIQSGKKVVY